MPERYELSAKTRELMAQDEPAVKAALCKIANANFATAQDELQGIFKYEGGIRVNNMEIVIKSNFIAEDWRRERITIPEETAVLNAITEVADLIKKHGIEAVREQYGECTYGNPLVYLVGLD